MRAAASPSASAGTLADASAADKSRRQVARDATIERVIESGRQTIDRVNGVLQQWEQLKEKYKLDPEEMVEAVRRAGGDQAVAEVQAEADRILADIRQQVEQDSMHQSQPAKAGQLARRGRRSLI